MGDGERAAAWLEKAREGEWDELALCANMVCFQHMKDDPHLKPVITAIGRAEVARLEKKVPMGRMGKPGELKGAIAFLAGDGASYLTATTIFADGGIMHSSPGL